MSHPDIQPSAANTFAQIGQDQTTMIRLTGVLVVLSVVLGAAVGLLWVQWATDDAAIHYVAITPGLGISRPGEISTGAAEAFAQAVTLHLGNVMPATAMDVYGEIERYLHPQFAPRFKAWAAREVKHVQDGHVASLVSVRGVTIEQDQRLSLARIDAVRRVYVGEAMVREEAIEVEVRFFPATVTALNIYGLVIADLFFPQLGRPLDPAEAAGKKRRE